MQLDSFVFKSPLDWVKIQIKSNIKKFNFVGLTQYFTGTGNR